MSSTLMGQSIFTEQIKQKNTNYSEIKWYPYMFDGLFNSQYQQTSKALMIEWTKIKNILKLKYTILRNVTQSADAKLTEVGENRMMQKLGWKRAEFHQSHRSSHN